MKKILIIGIVTILSLVLTHGFADAKVTGRCDGCHTMHNSQDGECQARVYSGGSVVTTCTLQEILLKGDCIGCHSRTDSTTIDPTNQAPIVFNSVSPTNPLAGGNFYYSDQTKVHNVATLKSADTKLTTPPGFKSGGATKPTEFNQGGSGWGPTSWTSSAQVTCAGQWGCHGDRSTGYGDYSGIRGGHHADDASIDGSTVGKSYRFLAGIKGAESNDGNYRWEQTADSTHHNGYYGSTTSLDDNTISYLCAECHGNYHRWVGGGSEVGTGTPWLRHPTDIALNATTGSTFTTDYITYNIETPVAYTSPTTNSPTVNTSSIVMCLSCHRAHGTDRDDILRFNYGSMNAGNGTSEGGCERCHKTQR